MATSLSLLHSPTCPSLRAGKGAGRPATPSLRPRSALPNGRSIITLAGPTTPASWSPLAALRGTTAPPRRPLLLADRLMGAGGARSWGPSLETGQARRLSSLHRRAISDEKPCDVVVKEAPKKNSDILPPGWPSVALALFGLGCLLGPPLDAIHSRVGLQVYDNGAINLFGLQTSIWVPPLLGVFYCLTGLLQLVLDKKLARRGNIPSADLAKVAASFVTLAVLLELSAELYNADVPANIEGYTLFFCAQLNWVLFENTWWGFGLASLLGVVCPLAEVPIVKMFGLWHYPQANVSLFGEGFVTWVICCYFFYTPSISNLARWLVSYQERLKEPKQ